MNIVSICIRKSRSHLAHFTNILTGTFIHYNQQQEEAKKEAEAKVAKKKAKADAEAKKEEVSYPAEQYSMDLEVISIRRLIIVNCIFHI